MNKNGTLRWAAILVAFSLIVQLVCLLRVHPLSFITFLVVGCPLMAAGIALYLVHVLRESEPDKTTNSVSSV